MNSVDRRAAKHHARGLELAEQNMFEEALVAYTKAIFLAPDTARFYVARAEAYLALCDFKSAASNYSKAVALDNEDGTTRTTLARVLAAMGHARLEAKMHEAAVALLSQSIALDAHSAWPYVHRALAHIPLRNWTNALADLDAAIKLEHNSADLYVLRGKLHWRKGNQQDGNEDFKRAHALQPLHPEVLLFEQMMWEQADQAYQGASSCLLQGQHEQAIELLTAALELNPGDVKVLVLRASAKRQQGTDESFEMALEDLADAAALYSLNQKQVHQAEGAEASDSGLEVLEHPEITRQRTLTWNDMAVRYFKRREYDQAIALFNKAIDTERELAKMYEGSVIDARFFVNRGDCYRAMGGGGSHLEQALEDYRKALDLLPGNSDVMTRIALVQHAKGTQLFNMERYNEAFAEFSMAISHNPHVATFYAHRGNALYYQSKYAQAHADYKRALALDPEHLEASQHMREFEEVEHAAARSSQTVAQNRVPPSNKLPLSLRHAVARSAQADAKVQRVHQQRPDIAPRSLEDAKPKPLKLPPWKETDHLNPTIGGRNFGRGKT